MHFLLTGHTGFKGSWLTLLLKARGHQVSGISLQPDSESLFSKASIESEMKHNLYCDITKKLELENFFKKVNPDVVIHLAAQSLVRYSYSNPKLTLDTNLLGTLNVLYALESLTKLKAAIIVTTDKVYNNAFTENSHSETDLLGGNEPYSESKVLADLISQFWRTYISSKVISIVRAGNVIGGGDYASDRILPDLVESFIKNQIPTIRNPNSTRPWQHVLDCLNGYLKLIDFMIETGEGGIWNFGPDDREIREVSEVVMHSAKIWGAQQQFKIVPDLNLPETNKLILNSDKSIKRLNWRSKLDFYQAIEWTINWYKEEHSTCDAKLQTFKDIRNFENIVQ